MAELPKTFKVAVEFYSPNISFDEMSDAYMLNALQYHQWSVYAAADALKVSVHKVYRFIRLNGFDVKEMKYQAEMQKILDKQRAPISARATVEPIKPPEESILLPIGQGN